jgi:hypothetical protein
VNRQPNIRGLRLSKGGAWKREDSLIWGMAHHFGEPELPPNLGKTRTDSARGQPFNPPSEGRARAVTSRTKRELESF